MRGAYLLPDAHASHSSGLVGMRAAGLAAQSQYDTSPLPHSTISARSYVVDARGFSLKPAQGAARGCGGYGEQLPARRALRGTYRKQRQQQRSGRRRSRPRPTCRDPQAHIVVGNRIASAVEAVRAGQAGLPRACAVGIGAGRAAGPRCRVAGRGADAVRLCTLLLQGCGRATCHHNRAHPAGPAGSPGLAADGGHLACKIAGILGHAAHGAVQALLHARGALGCSRRGRNGGGGGR